MPVTAQRTHCLIIETASGEALHFAFPEVATRNEEDYRQLIIDKGFNESRASSAEIRTLRAFGHKWVLIFVK